MILLSKKFCFILTALLIYVNIIAAQADNIDSLKTLLQTEKQDTVRAIVFTKLGRLYLYSKPDTAMILAREGLTLSKRINFITGEIVNLNLLGNIFNVTGNYPRALELFLEALQKAESNNDQENISRLLSSIGILYSYQDDQRQSIDYMLKALAIAEKNNYKNRVAVNLINLGDSYEKINMLDSARIYTNRGYDMSLQMNNADNLGFTLNNLGNIYSKMKHDGLAMANYRLAIPYLLQQDNQETLSETYMGMTRLFQRNGMVDSCLYFARLSFSTAKNGGFISQLMNASIFLTDYYNSKNIIDSAFKYQSETLAAKETQFSQEKAREIQSLSFDEMLRQQKLEEAKMADEMHRRHNMQYAIISIFIVSFVILFLLLTQSILVTENWIRFLGLLGLLLVFEFVNMLIHPSLDAITLHSPMLMLLALVIVASLLIPLHHKLEHWITVKMVAKNKRIRLAAAKRIVAELEGEANVKTGTENDQGVQ